MLLHTRFLKLRTRSSWFALLAVFALLLPATSHRYAAKATAFAIVINPNGGAQANLVGESADPSHTLTASGGTAPYVFSLSAGSLPPGLTIFSNGGLGGTITTQGSYSATIRATDSLNAFGEAVFTFTIATMSPATLPTLRVGTAVNVPITLSGGIGATTFSLPNGGGFANLSITPAGVLTGTPTGVGSYTVKVRATDSSANQFDRDYGGSVLSAGGVVLTILPATLPTLTVGVPFSQQLTVTGGTGTGRTWNTTTGQQIPGVALNFSTGLLSGTPTTAGPYNRGFSVTDSGGNGGNIVYSGTVNAPVPTMPQWMLIILAAILMGVAAFRLRTRAAGR